MRIIRFAAGDGSVNTAAVNANGELFVLPYGDLMELVGEARLRQTTPLVLADEAILGNKPLAHRLEDLKLLTPLAAPEVWASGVTYLRSREARNYESAGDKPEGPTCYDKAYEADRPEIFFKATEARTVGPNEPVYLRSDSNWQVPEPELGLVLSSRGEIVGYTIGNDMSSRDIEGENPLYLPQAKIWKNSCSIGPAVLLAEAVDDPYAFEIKCRIYRNETLATEGYASTSQLKRRYEELVEYLGRDNEIFDGTVMLTGTCIVPPNDFTLQHGDRIEIEIPGIGILSNPVHQGGQKKQIS